MRRAGAPSLRGTVSPRRPQWMRVAHRHLLVYLYLWVWAVLLAALAVTMATGIIAQVGTVNVSIVQFIRNGPLVWFLFSLGIVVATSYLAPHVANGMTRRSFVRGSLAAAGLSSLIHTVTWVAMLLAEGAVYDRMGWDHDTTPGEEYTAGVWELGVGHVLLDHLLATLSGSVTGLLVGLAYYRLGGWWGTIALPLTVLPILTVMFLTTWSDVPFVPWEGPTWPAYAISGLLVIAGAAAFTLLARRAPIARTES